MRVRILSSNRGGAALLGSVAALLALSTVTPTAAQEVTGRVTVDGGRPLASVQVLAGPVGAPLAAALTGTDGGYRLSGLTPGEVVVTVRAIGYGTATVEVRVPTEGTVRADVELRSASVELNPIVVTGTLSEQRVLDSPVKVEVVSRRVLERNASRSLMDAVGRVNGLFEQVDCGVCYTNSIRINGMEGPYTAVLIDGMPIMGALASVYGLNGIDPRLVDQIEILKGPQSTLYGTEAMGGVINVITRDPRFAPRVMVDANVSDLGQLSTQLSWAPSRGDASGLFSVAVQHNDRFVDRNGDRFSDLTLDTRATAFGKVGLYRDGLEWAGLTGKLYLEDRFGGVEGWTEADRGRRTVYGEAIETRRAELAARIRLPSMLRATASYTWHDQESWYGDTHYAARQDVAFAQLLWDPPEGRRFDPLIGLAARWDRYDDQTPATPTADVRFIPSVFAESVWRVRESVSLLGGLRLDHQGRHGAVLSPRASLKWTPWTHGIVRGSFGTGFRAVNLFTEDHAALTGARTVVIEEGLEPERSRSFALNLNQILEFGDRNMMIDVDLFHTRFTNRILPDYDTDPDLILYSNLDGTSVSRGVAISLNQNFGDTPLLYNAGVTIQDVFVEEPDGARTAVLFAADYTGTWGAQYTFAHPAEGVTLSYGGRLVGPMRLPRFDPPFERPTVSDAYVTHDLQLELRVAGGREVYVGVENLSGFRQASPLIDPQNPFGDAFDTSYAYGPVVGRRVFAGVRWAVSR